MISEASGGRKLPEWMPHSSGGSRPPLALWCLLLGAVVLMFWRLGDRDLWSSHEARAALDAESLLDPDSDGVPRLPGGRPEVQKPPLFYWLVAGIARLRGGVDAVAVRLPAAISAAGVLLVVGLGLGVGLRRPLAGLLAMLILATGIHFPWLARIGRIDMPLSLTVALAGMAFLLAMRRREKAILFVSYSACAVGVLLKGPIGLALPGAIVAAILLAERRWPACWELSAWRGLLGELRVVPGLLFVLVAVVPVFLWLDRATAGEFGREFLWHHNVQRGLGGSSLRAHAVWLYLPYLLVYLLPWSLLLAPALWSRIDRLDPDARAGLAWLIGSVVLLSAARFKRVDYLLPAYPGAAIFLGCWLEHQFAGPWRRPVLAGVAGVGALMVAGWAVRIGVLLPREEAYRDYRPFAALVRRHAATTPVVFFQAEAHALAFRVGRPVSHLVEWPGLERQMLEPGPHWVVTRATVVPAVRERLAGMELDEVAGTAALAGGSHERPLVLLRVRPRAAHAESADTASRDRQADQRRSARP